MRRLVFPPLEIASKHNTAEVWNPLTGAINSTLLRNVRLRARFTGAEYRSGRAIQVLPCAQFSDDGLLWSSSETGFGANYLAPTNDEWTWLDGTASPTGAFTDVFGGSFSPRCFVRFGLRALNTETTDLLTARCELVLEAQPIPAHTLRFAPIRVHTGGNASWGNELFFPTSAPISTEDVGEVRSTLWMDALTTDVTIGAALQVTDTPEDPSSWTTWTTLWGTRTSNGVTGGTTFTSVGAAEQAKNWCRFGVIAKNTTGSTFESCLAALRVDYRRS